MGKRLADEIRYFLSTSNELCSIERISFIGHSLGGIIIRASLPHMEDLADKFHILITLSTPHLGYRPRKLKLFSAGMWVYKKLLHSQCLAQLSFDDHADKA